VKARIRRCSGCGELADVTQIARRCADCSGVWSIEGTLVNPFSRYEDDPAAQLFVAAFPSGATLEDIGEAFGVTRERVRQIEEKALRRFKHRLGIAGITFEDFSEMLARRSRAA
jgi:hypothetical protein